MLMLVSMTFIMMSPFIIMSLKSWIMIWVFLEVSSVSFISLLKPNESPMIYFLAQSFGSMMILYSVLSFNSLSPNLITKEMMIFAGLTLKMGLVPLHQWFVMLGSEMSMSNLLIMSTIQKLAPLVIMSVMAGKFFMMTLMFMGMLLSLFAQMCQQMIKEMLIYSSIFNTSWMVVLCFIDFLMSLTFFLIYSFVLLTVMMEIKKQGMNSLLDMKMKMNTNLALSLFSMSGIPPLLGFIPKWLMIKTMSKEEGMEIMLTIMIIMSTMMVFIYIRVLFPMMMKSKSLMNFQTTTMSMIMQLFLPMIFMMSM